VKVPKKITLTEKKPSVTKDLTVTIVNKGSETETITQPQFEDLVELTWTRLPGPEVCLVDPASLLKPPKKGFPLVLAPGKKAKIIFAVTWDCATDPAKTTKEDDHNDFEVEVVVDTSELGGGPDANPSDNVCPRPASGDDKGCGRKTAGVAGGPLTTDVVEK